MIQKVIMGDRLDGQENISSWVVRTPAVVCLNRARRVD